MFYKVKILVNCVVFFDKIGIFVVSSKRFDTKRLIFFKISIAK